MISQQSIAVWLVARWCDLDYTVDASGKGHPTRYIRYRRYHCHAIFTNAVTVTYANLDRIMLREMREGWGPLLYNLQPLQGLHIWICLRLLLSIYLNIRVSSLHVIFAKASHLQKHACWSCKPEFALNLLSRDGGSSCKLQQLSAALHGLGVEFRIRIWLNHLTNIDGGCPLPQLMFPGNWVNWVYESLKVIDSLCWQLFTL